MRAVVDPLLRYTGPNGLDVTRIAADEALDPGQNLRPGSQITEIRKPSDEALCLADFNHPPTVVSRLRQRNAALLAPIKGNTAIERSRSAAAVEWHVDIDLTLVRLILMFGGIFGNMYSNWQTAGCHAFYSILQQRNYIAKVPTVPS